MRSKYEPGDGAKESEVLEIRHRTPKRGLATARLRAHLGGFRINLSVVGPETEQPKHRFSFTRREGDDITQAAHNLIETLKEKAF